VGGLAFVAILFGFQVGQQRHLVQESRGIFIARGKSHEFLDILEALAGVIEGVFGIFPVESLHEAEDQFVWMLEHRPVFLAGREDFLENILPGQSGLRGQQVAKPGALVRIAQGKTLPKGFPQRLGFLGPDLGKHLDQPGKGQAVGGVGRQSRQGTDVLDVGLLEKAHPAHQDIIHAGPGQFHLQFHRMVMRAVEHRNLAGGRHARLQQAPDLLNHVPRLVAAVGQTDQNRLDVGGPRGAQNLLILLGIAGNDLVGHLENPGRAAIVFLKLENACIGIPRAKREDVLHLRAAPRVDALEIVADG